MPRVAAEECVPTERPWAFEAHRARETSLGGVTIRRALPARARRLIGPWCFLDRYGPLSFTNAKPMDVAPHPHIGIQTVSWLLDGEILHRDSLGVEALLRAGGVNVMTAGSGIAHSEETPEENSGRLNGVQLWIALPDEHRNTSPLLDHVPEVPRIDARGGTLRLFAGEHEGIRVPAAAYSNLVGIEIELHRDATLELALAPEREHGIYVLSGDEEIERHSVSIDTLYYLGVDRTAVEFRSREGARILLLGGVPLAQPVLMWWNFVARTPEEIAVARDDWENGRRFGEVKGYPGNRLPAPRLSRMARPNPAS